MINLFFVYNFERPFHHQQKMLFMTIIVYVWLKTKFSCEIESDGVTLVGSRQTESTHPLHSYTYLKKSVRQYSLPSLEKHLSVRGHRQSEHWTHFTCHALSNTFNRNRSRIGRSHPAHCTAAFLPPTARVTGGRSTHGETGGAGTHGREGGVDTHSSTDGSKIFTQNYYLNNKFKVVYRIYIVPSLRMYPV